MGHSHASSFRVVGQFLGYELKGHTIYRVHLKHGRDEYRLKLSSSARDDLLRAALAGNLKVGNWMQVSGLEERDKKNELKLKAYSIARCSEPKKKSKAFPAASSPIKVRVCQKSSCCKRGGKAVLKQLQKATKKQRLGHKVTVKGTGCMGKCSKGPVIKVGKSLYRKVSSKKAVNIIEQHIRKQTS